MFQVLDGLLYAMQSETSVVFRAYHSDAVPRLPYVSWRSFSGPHTPILWFSPSVSFCPGLTNRNWVLPSVPYIYRSSDRRAFYLLNNCTRIYHLLTIDSRLTKTMTNDRPDLSSERAPDWQNLNCLTVCNIWSWVPDGARHQDGPTDWPSVVTELWLWRPFCLTPACLLVCWTILRPWRWRRYDPPKRRVQLYGLHGVISQKMILFITTAVKTSNPTRIGLNSFVCSLQLFQETNFIFPNRKPNN
jgi:hypothetical protein